MSPTISSTFCCMLSRRSIACMTSLSAATTGRTSKPVTMRRSSMAKMFAGSAIATTSSSSWILIGRHVCRLARSSASIVEAVGSISIAARSTKARPMCSATARAICASSATPCSESTLVSDRPVLSPSATSSCSCVMMPACTRTRPRRLPDAAVITPHPRQRALAR